MKMTRRMWSLAIVAITLCKAGVTFAGPPVTVTFKNLGKQEATYKITNNNESATYNDASPKPKTTVPPLSSDTYIVQNTLSPEINFATVQYTSGGKTCYFQTILGVRLQYSLMFINNPPKIPQWNKSAITYDGAICNATITYQNPNNFTWAVEFTIK